jgi:hypothetical protein
VRPQEQAAEAVEALKRVPGALKHRSSSQSSLQAAAEAVQNNGAVSAIDQDK